MRFRNIAKLVFDVLNENVPVFLRDMFEYYVTGFNLRDNYKVTQHHFNTVKYGINTLHYQGAKIYNSLPVDVEECSTCKDFKQAVMAWDGPKCQCGTCILCLIRTSTF